jgi:S1-C subfamily serine protease
VERVIASAEAGAMELERPWAGVVAQVVDQDLASALDLARPTGLILKALHPLSPFTAAGLETGDVVTAIDGHEVATLAELSFRLDARGVGGTAGVSYLRRGEPGAAELALIAAPDQPPSDPRQLFGPGPLSGAVVANVNPAVAEDLGLPFTAEGVVVLSVSGRARANGLRPRDVIREVDGASVSSSSDLESLNAARPGPWSLLIDRGERSGKLVAKR